MIKPYSVNESKTIPQGEHRVKVIGVKSGESKSGKRMCTITFENSKGQQIQGYYLAGVEFSMKKLFDLQKACGVAQGTSADELVGKRCGILVRPQKKPQADGRIFMEIAGYGPEDAVEESNVQPISSPKESNALPF